jgi:DNA polymerase I
MSKSLATIILDVPVDWDEELFRLKAPDPEKLIPLFDELEFRTYVKRVFEHIKEEAPEAIPAKLSSSGQMDLFAGTDAFADPEQLAKDKVIKIMKENDFKAVQDEKELKILAEKLDNSRVFCFDTETTGLDSTDTQLVGIAFCIKPGQAWYVPFPEDQERAGKIAKIFKPAFENPKVEKTGQNLKFDIGVLKNYGINVEGKLFDTMLAHYLLQPDMRHNMDLLAETYLGYKPLSIEALIGKKGKNQGSMRDVPLEIITAYACEDAHVTQQLREVFEPMLKKNNLTRLFDDLETPLVYVLAEMERNGVKIDTVVLNEYSAKLQVDIEIIEKEIYDLAGTKFNIGSPKQLGDILFDKLKIVEKAKKTKTKQYSTSEDVLSKLANKHDIIQKILDYRSLTKLKSTYVDVFPRLISPKTGRLHASFNQAVAATGRLSSNNPNLQNIPIRTEQGREIRKAFVPAGDDYVLLAADYSQIELRIIASLSNDEAMIEAFRKGYDIHAATASKVFGVPLDEVTREMRRQAKTVNFGIVYGISAFGLSERLNKPRNEAAEIINNYFSQYPGIKKYMDETIDYARKHIYVETIMGRRRYINDINSSNGAVRGFAERNAINSPIQGSAADMIKLAMIRIYKDMKAKKLESKMILQVHDELVFDVKKKELDTMKKIIGENMKNAMKLEVDLEIDMNVGNNWLEAH